MDIGEHRNAKPVFHAREHFEARFEPMPEAWRLLENEDFDVLLTDWIMPVVDGLDLCNASLPDHDGVWVMHTPYLLFYPDGNRDDVPDIAQ